MVFFAANRGYPGFGCLPPIISPRQTTNCTRLLYAIQVSGFRTSTFVGFVAFTRLLFLFNTIITVVMVVAGANEGVWNGGELAQWYSTRPLIQRSPVQFRDRSHTGVMDYDESCFMHLTPGVVHNFPKAVGV